MGGTDARSNLIALTPRQHFVAHWMLWKAYGGNMGRAFFMMSNFGKYGKVNSRTYAMARADYSLQVKQQLVIKPNTYVATAETRQKMREKKLGKKLSPEHIEKVRQAFTGRKHSEETKRKVSEAKKGKDNGRTGYQQSQEARSKIAIGNINRPLLSCRGCKNTFKLHGGVKRWHLENCKGTQL